MIDNSKDNPGECESCGFETRNLKAYRNDRYMFTREPPADACTHKWLCDLCAGTMAGNAIEYPEQYSDYHENQVVQAICYVGNMILAALEKRKNT